MRKRWTVVVPMALVLAGCATASNPDAVDTLPSVLATKAAVPDCPPAATVNSSLGVKVREPKKTVNGIVILCNYAPTVATAGDVLVRFQTAENEAAFRVGRDGFQSSGQKTTDLPDLGDEAFSSSLRSGTLSVNTVAARKG